MISVALATFSILYHSLCVPTALIPDRLPFLLTSGSNYVADYKYHILYSTIHCVQRSSSTSVALSNVRLSLFFCRTMSESGLVISSSTCICIKSGRIDGSYFACIRHSLDLVWVTHKPGNPNHILVVVIVISQET